MASKTTKGRKNTRSKKKTRTKAKSSNAKNTELAGEITILVILTVCILLVLSNFGIGGIAGEAVSSVLFWFVWIYGICIAVSCFCGRRFFYFKQRKYTCLYKNRGRSIFVLIFDGNTGIDI